MQCPHCKAEWKEGNTKSQQQLENCPFCGESLATKKEEAPDTNTLGGVLRSLVLERGTDIYKAENGHKLKAFLSDIAVAFPKERKTLNIAIQENIPPKLLGYDKKAEDERQIAMYDCVYQLEEEYGLSKERATEVVNYLAVGLGWETQNNETQTKKTSSSKAKKNKDTSSPVDTVDFSKKKEIIVSKNGTADFESIQLAINAASKNTKILVEPGLYIETIQVNKNIEICGTNRKDIKELTSKEIPIICSPNGEECKISSGVKIFGIAFTHDERITYSNIYDYIPYTHLASTNKNTALLTVTGNATLENIAVLASYGIGIKICKTGTVIQPVIRNSVVLASRETQVLIEGEPVPVFQDCNICAGECEGIVFKQSAKGQIKNSVFFNNKGNQVVTEQDTEPRFYSCIIHGGEKTGLMVEGSSKPYFFKCHIHENKEQQIEISETANPKFESCLLNHVLFDAVPKVNPTPTPVQPQQPSKPQQPIPSASSSGSGHPPTLLNTKADQKREKLGVFLLFIVGCFVIMGVLNSIIQSTKLSNRDNLKSDYSYTPPEPTLVEMYVASDGLNVRSGPSTDYSLVSTVSRNTKLMVDKSTEKNGWLYVEFNGKTGYVNKNYLSDVVVPTKPTQPKVPQNMVYVEGGTFWMGSSDGFNDAKPVHEVTVSSFYMGKYEVTQEEYQAVMGSNPSGFRGNNRPVENVSWYDAVEYCNRLSKKEGLTPCYSGSGDNITCNWNANGYRLPTEAEWEYAARGGINKDDYIYSGSNHINEVAWYYKNSGEMTHDVGTKKANNLGIYDMSGNVEEWCWDWYDEDYYSKSPRNNPTGATSGGRRVFRGGGWLDNSGYCAVSYRDSYGPYGRGYHGFRVVRSSSTD